MCEQLFDFLRVKTCHDAPAENHKGTTNQVWLFSHQANSFFPGRRVDLHLLAPEEFVARVKKLGVIARADQFLQLRGVEVLFRQIAEIQRVSAALDELSSFPAGGSGRFVDE